LPRPAPPLLEPDPDPDPDPEEAVPPPVPPEPPVPPAPVALVPPDVEPPEPVAPVAPLLGVAELLGVLDGLLVAAELVLDGGAELAEEAALDVVEEVVVDVDFVVLEGTVAFAAAPLGTVREGAGALAPVVAALPPPQADRPTARNRALVSAARNTSGRLMSIAASGPEWVHTPAAVRAVVHVLLCELVTPIAIAEVLDGPGQLRNRWRERQQLRHDL